jgi:hypothetical protein
MTLRLEVVLFLWVTAIVASGAVIFRSNEPVSELASISLDSESLTSASLETNSALDGPAAVMILERLAPEPDKTSRTLFPVVPPQQQQDVIVVAEAPRVMPILKGIVSSGAELRAIFTLGTDALDYVPAGVGSVVAGYRIREILQDRVIATDELGAEVAFSLRGSGEQE